MLSSAASISANTASTHGQDSILRATHPSASRFSRVPCSQKLYHLRCASSFLRFQRSISISIPLHAVCMLFLIPAHLFLVSRLPKGLFCSPAAVCIILHLPIHRCVCLLCFVLTCAFFLPLSRFLRSTINLLSSISASFFLRQQCPSKTELQRRRGIAPGREGGNWTLIS